jgi:hypothetical protein
MGADPDTQLPLPTSFSTGAAKLGGAATRQGTKRKLEVGREEENFIARPPIKLSFSFPRDLGPPVVPICRFRPRSSTFTPRPPTPCMATRDLR